MEKLENDRIHENNRVALLVKNEIELMKCSVHNKTADFSIGNDIVLHSNCCCDEFGKQIEENHSQIIKENRNQ